MGRYLNANMSQACTVVTDLGCDTVSGWACVVMTVIYVFLIAAKGKWKAYTARFYFQRKAQTLKFYMKYPGFYHLRLF